MSRSGRFSRAATLGLVVLTALGVAGCGKGSEGEPATSASADVGYPFDRARIGPDGFPETPELTAAQEDEAVEIAESDPRLQELLRGRRAEWGRVGSWSRGRENMELLGAVIDIRLAETADYSDVELPRILNQRDLYGDSGPEGVPVGSIEPRIEPEIGVKNSSPSGVPSLYVLIDLEAGEVASIEPGGPAVDYPLSETIRDLAGL